MKSVSAYQPYRKGDKDWASVSEPARACKSVGGLGCLSRDRRLGVVGDHGRVPRDEGLPECAVEGLGSGLQEPVGTELRPLHLLLLGKALTDHDVDGRLYEAGRDRLAVSPPLAVIRDRRHVVPDVG